MQISNPLTHELFLPLALTFSGLLLTGLIGVLIGMAKSKDISLSKQLIKRWISWAVIAPMTVLALLSGSWFFAVLCAIISVVCVFEYCLMSGRSRVEQAVIITASALMPICANFSMHLQTELLMAAAALLLVESMRSSRGFESTCISLVALAYIPLLTSYAVILYSSANGGPGLLISLICSSALANIFAFIFGKLLGGPKLAEKISPNKTLWGVAGAVCGAYIGFLLLSSVAQLHLPLAETLLIPPVVATAGVLGDLFESFLKRSFQVKDAGTWLPGFGGALDRVDGLLFVLPCVYYLVSPAL